MERKFLITSIFTTLGAIAFLSGYLLTPGLLYRSDQYSRKDPDNQTGSLVERFNSKIEVGSTEDKVLNTVPLSSRKFLSFVNPFTDSQKIVAIDNSGNIVEIDLATLTEKVVYTGQASIIEAVLSPTGDSVVYSYYDSGNNKKHAYLNFRQGESVPITGDLKSAAFSPRGDQAAYLISRRSSSGTDGGGELLISKGGNIVKRALKTRLGAAVVDWPSDFISFISYDKNGSGDLFVLKEDNSLNKVLAYQYGLSVKWSPSGEKLVFSTKNSNNSDIDPASHESLSANRLFYQDIKNSHTAADLEINTDASKCVWSSEEEIICGVKNQTQVKDEFYKIGLNDKTKALVAIPSTNLLTKELILNHSGDALFVLNDIDNRLYVLQLKR